MGPRLIFPPFTFDRDERVLRRDGETVPLAPKAAEALALLLTHPGTLVEKATLRDALWPEGFVEDGNLTQTIYMLRRTLDRDGDGRAYVETIPRRGYRFVPPVAYADAHPPPHALRAPATWKSAVAAITLVAVLIGGVAFARGRAHAGAPQLGGEAGRAYALGRYHWNRRTEAGVRLAIADFARVVALAPNDAHGYAGLADAYATVGNWGFARIASHEGAYRAAERYAKLALRRDPRSGEALATLGWLALDRDKRLDRAEDMLREAIALQPDHGPAYESLGIIRLYRGDAEGARAYLHHATELDPLSVIDLVWYGRALYYLHRFTDARLAYRQALELDPTFADAHLELAADDVQLGRADDARVQLGAAHMPPHKVTYRRMLIALADLHSGRVPRDLPNLRPRRDEHVDDAGAAALCLALGRRDDAIAWLTLSIRHDPEAALSKKMLALDPRLDALHDDARFRALLSG